MIYDIDSNPLPSYLMNLDAGSVYVFTIRINCRTGVYLRSESVSDLLVEGKKSTDSVWVNLETTPIDLSAYSDTFQNYDIRLTAGAVSDPVTKNFKIYVQ